MSTTERAAAIRWTTWSEDAFARARAAGQPILLAVSARWSDGCREMDRVSYADPEIAAAVNDAFVPVRIDADERPDLAERYDLGGLPTTAFLTPDGELLGGGTFVDPDRLKAALPRVLRSLAGVEGRRAASSIGHPTAERPSDAALQEIALATFDTAHGGFGGAPKFPHTAPVRLALDIHEDTGDEAMLAMASRTLDAMGWGGLYDDEAGGFFRCCMGAGWTGPQREKLLATNAALLDLYLLAGVKTGTERWFARAADVVAFIERTLGRHDGAWRASAHAEASRVFSDANAHTVSAMLHAADVFKDEALGTRTIDALEHVLLASYKPGGGVAHYAAGARGLLADQVAMASAVLDAWEATGNVVYRMMAEELVHYAIRTMWDAAGGGFFDRDPQIYRAEPAASAHGLKPFVLNCDAAVVLRRTADAAGDGSLASRAADTLESVADRAASQGPHAAHYLIARRAILR